MNEKLRVKLFRCRGILEDNNNLFYIESPRTGAMIGFKRPDSFVNYFQNSKKKKEIQTEDGKVIGEWRADVDLEYLIYFHEIAFFQSRESMWNNKENIFKMIASTSELYHEV